MKLVIDTNIIISALINNQGLTRKLILDENLKLISPAYTLSEISKYKEYICKKAKINNKDFDKALSILFKYIKIIPPKDYRAHLKEANSLISDIKDITFLACAIAYKYSIWSEDKDLKEQDKIKVYSTSELKNKLQFM